MKTMHVLMMALLLVLLMTGLALADGGVARPRQVLGGGASIASASGGGIRINATLGQPIVGGLSGAGGVTVGQGFWHGSAAQRRTYLPLILREHAW